MTEAPPDTTAALRCWYAVRRAYAAYAFDRLAETVDGALRNLDHPVVAAPVKQLEDLRPALHPEYYVMALGTFSAGKSTFLNALLGRKLLPESSLRCTRRLTIIRHDPVERAVLCFPDGRRARHELDAVADLNRAAETATSEAGPTGPPAEREWLEVYVNQPALRDFVVLDSPGFDDAQRLDDQHSHRLLARADCVLWLVPAPRVGKDKDRELLAEAPASATRLGLLTKRDRLKPARPGEPVAPVLEQCLADARTHFGEVAEWLPVDSKTALQARLAGDLAAVLATGLPAVEARLGELARGAGGRGKLQARHHELDGVLTAAADRLRGRRKELEALDATYTEAAQAVFQAAAEALGEAADALLREAEGRISRLRTRLATASVELIPTHLEEGFGDRLVAHLDLGEMQFDHSLADAAQVQTTTRVESIAAAGLKRPCTLRPSATTWDPLVQGLLLAARARTVDGPEAEPARSNWQAACQSRYGVVLDETVPVETGPDGRPAATLAALVAGLESGPVSWSPHVSLPAALAGVKVHWEPVAWGLGNWLAEHNGVADRKYTQHVVEPLAANLWAAYAAMIAHHLRRLSQAAAGLVEAALAELQADPELLGPWAGSAMSLRAEMAALRVAEQAVSRLLADLAARLSLTACLLSQPPARRHGQPAPTRPGTSRRRANLPGSPY